MKRILLVTFVMCSCFLEACNSNGVKGDDNTIPAFKDGVVNQMSTEMFAKLVWDFKTNPKDFTFEGDLPVIIDFYADWCRPCRMVAPIMDEFAKEYKGKIRVFRVNTDIERDLSQLFQIRSIPAVMFVPKNGKPQMTVGALPKDGFQKIINDVLQVK
ncbi:MAG TPA: thioredoxin [Bacteroidales bacterium]|nr:thioredoxin [Bacteroidales bacterium]